jgi:hypothetical protein
MSQIGPTLASWLGVSLSDKADSPLAVGASAPVK